MDNEEKKYLSLQEATKYCNYSQEYLSLRARHGKLKAMKFGRNWVTKKEWLEEYLEKAEEYNNNLNNKKVAKFVVPPQNLPIEVEPRYMKPVLGLRFGFVTALVFVLLITGGVFGKTLAPHLWQEVVGSFQNVYNNLDSYVKEISKTGDLILQDYAQSFKNVGYQSADIGNVFKDYGFWLSQQAGEITRSYNTANNFVEEKLKQGYWAITQPFVKAYQFVTSPWRAGKIAVEEEEKPATPIQEEGVVIKEVTKEVSKITQIEPIKEITKETVKIDEKSITQLKTLQTKVETQAGQISNLQQDMARRPTGLISAPNLIQPVSQQSYSPKLYVENGQITLEVAGSGSIVFSAPDNIVASSRNFYISGNLIIAGTQTFNSNSSSTALTVVQNGTGNIVEFKEGGTSVFTIADGGYATFAIYASTTPAVLIRSPDTFWSPASSTYFAIAGTSTFNGRFIDIQKAGTSLFYIDGSGNIVSLGALQVATLTAATTTFTGDLTVFGNILPATTTTYNIGSSDYKWANIYAATATIGNTITINSNTISGSETTTINTTAGSLILNPAGNVGIGTTEPNARLQIEASSITSAVPANGTGTFTYDNPVTVDTPANGTGTIAYDNPGEGLYDYPNDAVYDQAIRVYAYKLVNGNPVFSSTYAQSDIVDNNGSDDNTTYYITWSWDAVPEADGYRILKYDPNYNGYDYNYYFDTDQTTFNDGDDSMGWSGGNTVTPTVGYAAAYTYPNNGYSHAVRVYSYKDVDGGRVYSSDYAQSEIITDNGNSDGETYYITWSWDAVPEADGYRILKYDPNYNGYDYDYYFDTDQTTFNDGDGSMGWSGGNTVTPTSSYTAAGLIVNGNVGIGTTNPQAHLEVTGYSNFTGTMFIGGQGANPYASVLSISAATPNVKLYLGGGTSQNGMYWDSAGGGHGYYVYNDATAFHFYDNTSAKDIFVFDLSQNMTIPNGTLTVSGTGDSSIAGNVGIGTTSPAYLLDVYGTFRALSTSTFGGYVGIGTTTPAYTLSVVGNVYGSGNAIFGGSLTSATTTITGDLLPATTTLYTLGNANYKWGNIYVATATIGNTIVLNTDTISATSSLNLTGAAASTWKTTGTNSTLTIQSASSTFISAANTLTVTSTGAMIFGTAGTERMRILTTGEVGIGTATPGAKLNITVSSSTEILRPNAVGDSTQFADSPDVPNWQNVDEEVADDGTTSIYAAGSSVKKDLYNITDSALTTETINKITLYSKNRYYDDNRVNSYFGLKSGTTEDWGTAITVGYSYTTFSREYTTDPNTGSAWTVTALNTLQIGLKVELAADQGSLCTQVYVEVNYTPHAMIVSAGNVGIGTAEPTYTLDTYGTFRALSTSTFGGNVGIETTSPGAKLEIEAGIVEVPFKVSRRAIAAGVETLRPNGAGNETNIYEQYPSEGYHWDKVDEATPDEDSTYVRELKSNTVYNRDLYAIADHSVGSGVINFIKVYARCRGYGYSSQNSLKIAVRSGTTVGESSEMTVPYNNYITFSNQWNVNPDTGVAWTWAEIDAIQAGIALRRCQTEADNPTYCTQVYVEVDYTESPKTTFFVINSAGNVGIGTTGPDGKLDILYDSTGVTTNNIKVLTANTTGATFDTTAGVLTNYGGYITGTATRSAGANDLTNVGLYLSASGAQNNYGLIVENGNVGIGTTGPTAKLYVETTDTTTVPFQVEGSVGGFFNPNLMPDWNYRKQITITGSTAGAQTNYQMKLTVNYGSGTDSGANVYLGDKSQADFDDIRFTKSDGTTLLDYWIESKTDGVSAIVWIEFDSISSSPFTANFYVYYGNPAASSGSNGDNTFLFLDDFETDKGWVFYKHQFNEGTGNRVTSQYVSPTHSYELIYDGTGSATTDMYVKIVNSFESDGSDIIVDVKYKCTQKTTYNIRSDILVNANVIFSSNTGIVPWTDISSSSVTNVGSNSITLRIYSYQVVTGQLITTYWDDVRVRKYASSEPTWGTWGSEEISQQQQTFFYIQNQTGNVGIGTAEPNHLLTVGKTGDATSTYQVGVYGSIRATGSIDPLQSFDIAERFSIEPQCEVNNTCPEAGDLVSITENLIIQKSSVPYDSKLIGVAAKDSAITMGGLDASTSRPVALAGRLLVKVSLENGSIQIGDFLTSASSTPGTTMKATKAGRVIGMALESFESTTTQCYTEIVEATSTATSSEATTTFATTTTEVCESTQPETGKVLVFINPHWIGNDLAVQENASGQIVNLDPEQLRAGLAVLGLVVTENGSLEVQKLKAKEIETEKITIQNTEISKTGITIFARDTGEPYCIFIEAGQMQSLSGVCGNQTSTTTEGGVCQTTTTETTTTESTTTEPVCTPDWQCSDWQSLPDVQSCGQTFTQTRTCTDSNNCGIEEEKPAETLSASGVKCEASNATGVCQSGGCNFTCTEGFFNCDNDMSNGCETQGECPPVEPPTE